MPLKIRNLLRLVFVLVMLGSFSVLLHEFVHVLQFHYLFGVPFNELELHFFWEYSSSNSSLLERITSHPAAWISFETFRPITPNERIFIEIPAYTIQCGFILLIYVKYIMKNKKFMWME